MISWEAIRQKIPLPRRADSHYAFSQEGEFLAQGTGVGYDEPADGAESEPLVVPQNTGLLLNTPDQANPGNTSEKGGVFLTFRDPDDEAAGEVDASSTGNIDENTQIDVPEGVIIGTDGLVPTQLLGTFLKEEPDTPKLEFPNYLGNWVEVESQEPPGAYCDDFEVISPKSGTIVLPPDSDLTFKYPSQAQSNWSFWYSMPASVRLAFWTTFHLARPNGDELKAPISQEYYFPASDFALQSATLLDPKSITYNYYQLQGMGLIIPGATSGQLVWWVENSLAYIDLQSGFPTGAVRTCITALNLINWTNTQQAEQPDILVVPVPGNETPFFTPQPLPITQPTDVPATQAPSDGDGDGVPDATDRCPRESGPAENGGCPVPVPPSDRDGDGVPDNRDRCPDQRGSVENAGCPIRSGG